MAKIYISAIWDSSTDLPVGYNYNINRLTPVATNYSCSTPPTMESAPSVNEYTNNKLITIIKLCPIGQHRLCVLSSTLDLKVKDLKVKGQITVMMRALGER